MVALSSAMSTIRIGAKTFNDLRASTRRGGTEATPSLLESLGWPAQDTIDGDGLGESMNY